MNALPLALEAPIPAARTRSGTIGRILLGAIFVAGLIVGYSSGLGLVLYVPFAGVGAFIVLRRPRLSIGWMLVAVGWGFALISSRIDLTVQQFEAGNLPVADLAFIVVQGFGYIAAFLLLPALVVLFPSGRLPSGTWGRAVRLGLAFNAVVMSLVVFAPTLNVNLVSQELSVVVRNPLAVLPDLPFWSVVNTGNAGYLMVISLAIAAISIGVRFRRAVGVERQQLKWLAVSIAFVALGVVFGISVAAVLPRVADTGIVWLPAILGFVGVPLSIAAAVLRYRLYEIDTIINRAIVYGLLTAILTGGSAAVIALGQRLFVGVIGAGSDATIVLTTLLVVTAFNPIKTRLQAIVDRRFKDSHSPDALLAAFVLEVRQALSPPDLHRSLARLLETSLQAYGSKGGHVEARAARRPPWTFAAGEAGSGTTLVAVASTSSLRVRLEISRSDESANAEALQAALEAIVVETSRSGARDRATATL